MAKINEVFFTDELEKILGYSDTHIRRLIKQGKADLIKDEDYRVSAKGIYLFEDTAIEKLTAYKESSPRSKNNNEK